MNAPAGWYPDSPNASQLRWWDGVQWTGYVVAREPDAKNTTPTFPAPAALFAIVGIAASVTTAHVLDSFTIDHTQLSVTVAVAVFYAPIYLGLAAICVLASKRFGSGSVRSDFGVRVQLGDLLRGPLVWFVAGTCATVATALIGREPDARETAQGLREGAALLPTSAIAVLAVAAVILAPIFEELVFRGLLQRALTARFGAPAAIVLQGAAFGAYHFSPDFGTANIAWDVGLAALGMVFGVAAWRWKRLGPTMIAHMIFNIFFVISVAAT